MMEMEIKPQVFRVVCDSLAFLKWRQIALLQEKHLRTPLRPRLSVKGGH